MPLTQESFRPDPRRRVFVQARAGFFLEGRDKAIEPEEVVEVPWAIAVQLFHSNKAHQTEGPARSGKAVRHEPFPGGTTASPVSTSAVKEK